VVFNPLPWERSAEIRVTLPEGAAIPSSLREVNAQQLTPVVAEGRTLQFVASALPPGGYKTFAWVDNAPVAVDASVPSSAGALETAHFKLHFDLERGGIASLIDKTSNRELVSAKDHVLGQFLHQRFDRKEVAAWVQSYQNPSRPTQWNAFGKPGMASETKSPHWDAVPGPWKLAVSRDALGVRAVLTCENTLGLAEGYTLTFTFPNALACVDVEWQVKNKTANPLPEGGWLCVPAALDSVAGKPVFRVGEVGGSIDPATDIVSGSNRNLLAADRGITVRAGESGAGIGVASVNLPLWSLGEPGLWKYSDDYVPEKPELFANLYNNMWNTNYPLWIGGSWKASFRLWPVASHAGEEKAVFTPAWELRQGAIAGYAEGRPGQLPATQPGVSLSRKGVRVTAYGPESEINGTILRLWEQAGAGGELTVTLPAGVKFTSAQPVNLRGEKEGALISVKDGQFHCALGAWSPATFLLQ
jgi:hypothetical protein